MLIKLMMVIIESDFLEKRYLLAMKKLRSTYQSLSRSLILSA
jgi:hypothetical protein